MITELESTGQSQSHSAAPRKRTANRLIAKLAVLVVTLVGFVGITAAPAHAAPCSPTSCVYNYNGSNVALSCVTGSGCTMGTWVPVGNGFKVNMYCWFDDTTSSTGNYSSKRWFQVTAIPLVGRWYVHSSYVYNQTTVGHC